LQNGFSAYAIALTAISRLQYRHRCTFSRISGDIVFSPVLTPASDRGERISWSFDEALHEYVLQESAADFVGVSSVRPYFVSRSRIATKALRRLIRPRHLWASEQYLLSNNNY
jgi:hypothetical protein